MEVHPKKDDCLSDEDTNIKTKFTVSTTGISRVMLESIKKRLKAIGGTYSETLDLNVTHLIARKLGSEKTNFASKYDIPMVKQRWLQICFENGRLMPVTGCRFKPLESFSICVSGSNGIDRAELERRVTKLGGEFTRQLHGDGKTTHLLALPPLDSLGKFTAATQWKIPVVGFGWIEACEKAQKYVPHDKYVLSEESVVGTKSAAQSVGGVETASSSFSKRQEHDIIPSSVQSQLESRTRVNKRNKSLSTLNNNRSILRIQQDYVSRITSEFRTRLAKIIERHKGANKPSKLFDGMRFLFFGFHKEDDLLQLKLALRGTSGIPFRTYNATVTHIIVPNNLEIFGHKHLMNLDRHIKNISKLTKNEMDILRSYDTNAFKPHVFQLNWFLESLEKNVVLRPKITEIENDHELYKPSNIVFQSNMLPGLIDAMKQDQARNSSDHWPDEFSNDAFPSDGNQQEKEHDGESVSKKRRVGDQWDGRDQNENEVGENRMSVDTQQQPLHDLTVCVTGYTGNNRTEIRRLSKTLGATFTDILHKRCTHLVSKWTKGEKYEKAKKWGHLHVVTKEWLDASYEFQSRANENDFPPIPV